MVGFRTPGMIWIKAGGSSKQRKEEQCGPWQEVPVGTCRAVCCTTFRVGVSRKSISRDKGIKGSWESEESLML